MVRSLSNKSFLASAVLNRLSRSIKHPHVKMESSNRPKKLNFFGNYSVHTDQFYRKEMCCEAFLFNPAVEAHTVPVIQVMIKLL